MGGLGLPRLTTYINTRKWCMAQRALIHEDNTAKAVHGLLDRAARHCGSPVVPSQPTDIYSTTSTPAWGSSLGALAGAPSPILVTSSALVHPRHGKRHLLTLQQRGLVTLLSWSRSQATPPPRPTADPCGGAWLPPHQRLRPTHQLIGSHPGRLGTPRSGWDQSQWGIYLADLFERAPASPTPPGLPLQIGGPISYKCISEGANGPEDWHWATAGHAPLLGALRGMVNTLSPTPHRTTPSTNAGYVATPDAAWHISYVHALTSLMLEPAPGMTCGTSLRDKRRHQLHA